MGQNQFLTLVVFSIVLFVVLFASSCKPSKQLLETEKPKAKYDAMSFNPQTSTVNIPIKMSVPAIEAKINKDVTGLLYEDKSYDDNDGDNLKMKIWKQKDIKLSAYPDAFEYYVPLKLSVKMRYGVFGTYGYQSVEGSIALSFRTVYEIDESWDLATVTVLTDYKWLHAPTTSILGQKVSIKSIANRLLKSNKQFLENSIDEQIKANLNIKEYAQDAWTMLQDPINVNEDYKVWLKLSPKSIQMTPLKTEKGIINATIGIQSAAEVVLSEEKPKVTINKTLPPFVRPEQIKDDFQINLTTEIPYVAAEKIAKKEMVGQTFSQGKRSVTVKNLTIYGQGEQVIIGALVDGSVKGMIYMRGKPVFDPATSTVKIENVDYDLDTKNGILKSANWLFHSTILKKIEPYLTFPLEQNIKDAQKMIQDQLKNYEPVKGILLNGQLDELKIEGLYLTPNGFRVVVLSNGKLNLKVDGLNF